MSRTHFLRRLKRIQHINWMDAFQAEANVSDGTLAWNETHTVINLHQVHAAADSDYGAMEMWVARAQLIDMAEATLGNVDATPEEVTSACDAILAHSTDPRLRRAAEDILTFDIAKGDAA